MDDSTLDSLLLRAAPAVTPGEVASARALANQVAEGASRPTPARTRWRRWVFVAAAGTVVLTGGGTTRAYLLSVAPFQTLETYVARVPTGIEVEYRNSLDKVVSCKAFMEVSTATTPVQQSVLAALASRLNADQTGARVANAAVGAAGPDLQAQESAVFDAVDRELRLQAVLSVPALTAVGSDDPVVTPRYMGTSMSCPEGNDGR